LEAERKANQILSDAQSQARRRIKFGSIFLCFSLLAALAAFGFARRSNLVLAESREELGRVEEERKRATSEKENLISQINALGSEISSQEAELQKSIQSSAIARESALQSEALKRQAENTLAKREAELSKISNELNTTIQNLDAFKKEAQIRISQANEEIKLARQNLKSANQEVEDANQEVLAARAELLKSRADLRNSLGEVEDLQNDLNLLTEQVQDLMIYLNQLDAEIEASGESYVLAEINVQEWQLAQENLQSLATELDINIDFLNEILSALDVEVAIKNTTEEARSETRRSLRIANPVNGSQSTDLLQLREGDELGIYVKNNEQTSIFTYAFSFDECGESYILFPFSVSSDDPDLNAAAGMIPPEGEILKPEDSDPYRLVAQDPGVFSILFLSTNFQIRDLDTIFEAALSEVSKNITLEEIGSAEYASTFAEEVISLLSNQVGEDAKFSVIEMTAEIVSDSLSPDQRASTCATQ